VSRRERRVDHARWVPTVGPGMILGVLGTAGLVVSMFMAWRDGGVHPSDVPLAFLFDSTTTSNSPSILLALIPFAALVGIGSLLPRASGARVIGALGAIAVVVLFAVQTHYLTDRVPGVSMWDVLDTGFYVAAIASVVALVSGFMPSGWTRRRWSETENDFDDGNAVADDGRRY
jgi:hypothetical protein